MSKWIGSVSPSRIDLAKVGGSSWGLVIALAAAAAAIVAAYTGAEAVLEGRVPAVTEAGVWAGRIVGSVVTVAALAVVWELVATHFLIAPVGPLERRRRLREAAEWRAEQAEIARAAAKELAAEVVEAEEEAHREHEEREVAAAQLTAVYAAEAALAATEGLDGHRDGRLIDASDRFRRIGVFPVDESTSVDQPATVIDHPSTTLDREA